jgi:predicted dehydrogenase
MTNTPLQTPASLEPKPKIRYAVVGLGWYSQSAALPAFANAENSELVALVSDDETKLSELGQKYGVQLLYTYANYDELLTIGDIDAIYIGLPNHLHADFTIRALQAGIHVLCEKPMAVTVAECEQTIAAARERNTKLMIAYRLHFEAANLNAIEVVKSGQIGEPRIFNSVFSQQTEAGNIRLKAGLGGGTLYDIGIYCINAARYIFQAEPIEVFATSANNGEERFNEVEEMTSAILRFPGDRLATFSCSLGAAKISTYTVVGTTGTLMVEPAYASSGSIKHKVEIEGDTQEREFPASDQVAAELVYFSDCVLYDKDPEPSGHEGLIDVQIITALYESIRTRQFVSLADLEPRQRRPSIEQIIELPAQSEKQELINAADPGGNR